MKGIDIHADDYGLSKRASEDILACIRAGRLDSISVMANMSCYKEYARKFCREKAEWKKSPLLTVHLNFMEGRCVASREKLPCLVGRDGYFKISWGSLLLGNYSPFKYKKLKKELKEEIKAQTERFRAEYGREYGQSVPLRFDGHQHTQMIPIVYKSLLEVIREENYLTDYIRVTKEPVLPYLKKTKLWKTYAPVNGIKNLLLNFYSSPMEKALRKNHIPQKPMYLWGVLMSGHMDKNRVSALLPLMKDRAEKKDRTLEILFHPGLTPEEDMGEEFSSEAAKKFYFSKGRRIEYEAVFALMD